MTDQRIEIAIPADLLAGLKKQATEYGESVEHLIVAAAYRFVADEEEAGQLTSDDENTKLDALLKKGIDELDRGEYIPHDEVVWQINERLRRAA